MVEKETKQEIQGPLEQEIQSLEQETQILEQETQSLLAQD